MNCFLWSVRGGKGNLKVYKVLRGVDLQVKVCFREWSAIRMWGGDGNRYNSDV